ncbi:MAG: hypothetical protein J4F36_04035 [Nitrosopumilaceae archaeon]|nr:hypothetical protein [Nitrosopumilaceae archaeon]
MKKPNPWEENRIYLLKKAQDRYLASKHFFQFIKQSCNEFRPHGVSVPYKEDGKPDLSSGILVWCFLPDEFILTNRIISKIYLSFNQEVPFVDIWVFDDSITKIKERKETAL